MRNCSALEDEMTYTITEADRKRLIVFLKKCPCVYKGDIEHCEYDCPELRREDIFQSPDDRQALCEALGKNLKWTDFYYFCLSVFAKENASNGIGTTQQDFTFWLLVSNPERCNYLIARFLEGE
jgi:hypothetical protein